MTTLNDVRDVPMYVRIKETNAFVREVPYHDQAKKSFALVLDFEKLANHARYNYYCISFLKCPYQLNVQNLLAHFDWFNKYLYFNFEQSVLLFDIFPHLEKLNHFQQGYLAKLLREFPRAYEYDIQDADPEQKWALRKKFNFQKCDDFRKITEIDGSQRILFLECLQSQLRSSPTKEIIPSTNMATSLTTKRREREASLYNYLKLNDHITAAVANVVIKFLYDLLKDCFRKPYTPEEFTSFFTREACPVLELKKQATFDNQHLKVLFQELKRNDVLAVSWPVINQKVRVFSAGGKAFSGFSEVSAGKIAPRKVSRMKKLLSPLFELVNKTQLTLGSK